MCRKCGGECCKHKPGLYHPDQLFADIPPNGGMSSVVDRVHALLDSGKYILVQVLDEEDKDPYTAIQPRTSFVKSKIAEDDYGVGQCVNLTDTGCSLVYSDRPLECQRLVPAFPHSCRSPDDIEAHTLKYNAWRKYRLHLKRVSAERWNKYATKL